MPDTRHMHGVFVKRSAKNNIQINFCLLCVYSKKKETTTEEALKLESGQVYFELNLRSGFMLSVNFSGIAEIRFT